MIGPTLHGARRAPPEPTRAVRARRLRAGAGSRPAGLLAALLAVSTGACVCPAPAIAVADASFLTPEATVRSYQAYLASDLVDWEYRCYSRDFKRRNGISLGTYAEARAVLFDERPWLKLVARADIVRQWPEGEGVHAVELGVMGRTVHVRLVREDSFEILAGDRLVTDGFEPFERLVAVRQGRDGPVLQAAIPTDEPELDLSAASAVRIERLWKIDELYEPPDGEPGADAPAP